jgi:NAD(P)-dependent dehydrogenase (short-subunit alcohol dehydrogenase family)
MSIVIVGAGPNLGAAIARRFAHPRRAHTAVGGSIAPDGDHHPDEVADLLWRHHSDRADFQVRIGID